MKRLAIILGIRSDVIQASLILNSIRATEEFDVNLYGLVNTILIT